MEIKDLVEGEIYIESHHVWDYCYLIKYKSEYDICMYSNGKNIFRNNRSPAIANKNCFYEKASSEQAFWLNKCIEANKFIEYNEAIKTFKQYTGEVVHCTTQEEWNFVIETLKSGQRNWFKHKNYGNKKSFCIDINTTNCSESVEYYQEKNYKIYSFQEWCNMFGHKPDFKPNFEVGKWYKISNNWYAKFNMIHGQNTYWQYTESITNKGKYEKISGNLKMSDINSGLKIELLTDLSEIQEFLPDGHPDKKIKYQKLLPEHIQIGTVYYRKGYCSSENPRTIVKIDGIKFYYDNDSGKYNDLLELKNENFYLISLPKKPINLIGRYLKYIGNSKKDPEYGDYFRIDSMEINGLFRLKDKASNCHWTPDEVLNNTSTDFELMPEGFNPDKVEDNIPKYVKCVKSWSENWTTNKIYKVEKNQKEFPKKLTLKCDNGEERHVIDWYITKENNYGFSIVTEKEYLEQQKQIEIKEELNVKDWITTNMFSTNSSQELKTVKILKDLSDEIEIGDEVKTPDGNGILIAIINFDCGYLIKNNMSIGHNGYPSRYKNNLLKGNFSDKRDSWYYHLSDLKLIKKASNTTINKKDEFVSPIQVHNNVTDFSLNEKLDILDIFKPKSSKEMDFTNFKQQNPKELYKIDQQKYLTN